MSASVTELRIPVDPDEPLDDDEYADIIKAELDGNEAARTYLEHDLDSWMHGLQRLVEDVQVQFARRKAEDATVQQACFAAGKEGKTAWFAHLAQSDQWRGAANGFLRHVTARLREVKLMRHDENVALSDAQMPNITTMLRQVLDRLDRIEAALAAHPAGSGK